MKFNFRNQHDKIRLVRDARELRNWSDCRNKTKFLHVMYKIKIPMRQSVTQSVSSKFDFRATFNISLLPIECSKHFFLVLYHSFSKRNSLTHSNTIVVVGSFPKSNENFLTIIWNECRCSTERLLGDWDVDCTEMHWSIKYEMYFYPIFIDNWKFVFFRIHTGHSYSCMQIFSFFPILKTFVVSISFTINCVDDLIQQRLKKKIEPNWRNLLALFWWIYWKTYDLCMEYTRRRLFDWNRFLYFCFVFRQLLLSIFYCILLQQHFKSKFQSQRYVWRISLTWILNSASSTPRRISIFI